MSLTALVRRRLPRLYSRIVILRLVRDALAGGEPELRLLGKLAPRAGVFVDVGANRGVYSFVARRSGLDVVALEPNPDLAAFLRDWADDRVVVVEASASDRAGAAVLEIPLAGETELDGLGRVVLGTAVPKGADHERPAHAPGPAARHVRVASVRLDDLGLRNVAVVKIDVEGHELEVLEGAARTLSRQRPVVIVEAEERHRAGACAAVRELLERHGYRGFFVLGDGLRPVEQFTPERLQRAENIRSDGTRLGEYVNNFVFLPQPDAEQRAARLRVTQTDAVPA
jgi:FkbM family methyltransferase